MPEKNRSPHRAHTDGQTALASLSPAHQPFVAARSGLQARLDITSFGVAADAIHRFDPTHTSSATLLDRLERLDALRYAPLGMKSPRWALYDCAELPGAVAGFGARAGDLTPAQRAALEIGEDDAGLVPLSMVVATPMLDEGRWLIYAMCAVDESLSAALAMTFTLLGARRIAVAPRWTSSDIGLLASFAPLEVLAAWLPGHDHQATCVLDLDLNKARFTATPVSLSGSAELDVNDEPALQRLQGDLETGGRAYVVEASGGAAPRLHRVRGSDRGAATTAGAELIHPVHAEDNALLAHLDPFVLATQESLARFDRCPFGVPIASDACLDPLRKNAMPLLELLYKLDTTTFGPEGMPMPRWLFLEGSALPGAIVGLGRRSRAVPDAVRAALCVPDSYEGIVPYSMYIAIPSFDEGAWVGHNLASLRERLPSEPLRGLGGLTKAVALKVVRASAQLGMTQWNSRALHVHARIGPLALLTAWTPAHSEPATLTYRTRIDDHALRRLAFAPCDPLIRPAPVLWLDSADVPAMQALQARIEAGEQLCVADVPEPLVGAGGGRQRVPIAPFCERG